MKTVTVRDLRNNFARVAAWVGEGESVAITRAGKPFACLTPIASAKATLPKKPDIMARLKRTWGARCFSAQDVTLMRAAELDEEQ